MAIVDLGEAIDWQATHALEAGAPITARMIRAQRAVAAGDTELARRMKTWPGLVLEDALPLRLAAGLHWLHLSGADQRLAAIYAGDLVEQVLVDECVAAVARDWDARLLPWLDHPPQTNEAGRSAALVSGLLWLARELGPRFELNEIGASAGVNTMIERYRYDLGGVAVGPEDSPMHIAPMWRGLPPPVAPVEIVSIRGCDVAPVNLADPAEALRLKAYVWADAHERMGRIEAATRLAAERPPRLTRQDASAFVAERLAEAQAPNVTRVLYHSVMWQYLPAKTRGHITTAMEQAGTRASAERPLAWVRLETNRTTFRHELDVRYWPGGSEPVFLAEAHPHGAWVHWRGR
jgi:hypothetical protein